MTDHEVELIARRVAELIGPEERWLDRKQLAEHYSCSVRMIELAMADENDMPRQVIFRRVKFRLSEVDPWLREHGYVVDGRCTVDPTQAPPRPMVRPGGMTGR